MTNLGVAVAFRVQALSFGPVPVFSVPVAHNQNMNIPLVSDSSSDDSMLSGRTERIERPHTPAEHKTRQDKTREHRKLGSCHEREGC
jgi:hypothetical protein